MVSNSRLAGGTPRRRSDRLVSPRALRFVPLPLFACVWLFVGNGLFGVIVAGQGGVATIDPEDVRPGMRGYGLTVFRGTRPERFDVEVIDVVHNFRPSQDLILIHTRHPILEKAKVVAGMSGSPVYLEGKLAGAYAYGWSFGSEPVAGVTPIRNMLKELRRPIDPRIWDILGAFPRGSKRATAARNGAGGPHASNGRQGRAGAQRPARGLPPYWGTKRRDALWALREAAPEPAQYPRAVRAQTPLMLGGFDDTATAMLTRALAPYALLPVQAGGGGAAPGKAGPARASYVDGGSVGVQLIRGDVSATAIGTVTHVEGRKLIGFGHPMMNAGQTAMPTTTAKVLHVLSSVRRSFKLARPIAPLGAMVHDRMSAIVVDADVPARTVPVRLRVHGALGAPRDEWRMEVASGRGLTPALVFAGLLNALQATAAGTHDVAFRAVSTVRIPEHGELTFRDEGHLPSGAAGPTTLARMRVFSAIEAAYGNPFERARIDGLDIELHLDTSDDVAMIVDASVGHREVDPGSKVDVYVTLRRYDGVEEVRRVNLLVPASAAGEKIEIEIAPGDRVRVELPKPRNLDDLLEGLKVGYPATSLVLSMRLPSRGLRTRGHVVRHLPGSALDALQVQSGSDRPTMFATLERVEVPLGRAVYGKAKLQLEVREEPR